MRAALLGLMFLVCVSGAASAQPASLPAPYMAGPTDAPGPASLAGTRWRVTVLWEGGNPANVVTWAEFEATGLLVYGYANGQTFRNGTWRQRGSVLVWEMNSMYQVGQGQIEGDRITGTSITVGGRTGHYVFDRQN